MNYINVLTYNLSWEALESKTSTNGDGSTRLDMSHCKLNEINTCTQNIAYILLNTKPENEIYDFIALQEVKNTESQWLVLQNEIIKLSPTFFDNYNIEFSEYDKAGLVSIYNKKYILLFKTFDYYSDENNKINLFQILVFQQIIFINVHFPHNNQENFVQLITKKLLEIQNKFGNNFRIILAGDFNNINPLIIPGFSNLINGFTKNTLFESVNTIQTCEKDNISQQCIISGYKQNYNILPDHIFDNYFNDYEYYTRNFNFYTDDMKPLMSDHLPVYARLKISSPYYEKYLKYKIKYNKLKKTNIII
jgi:hypothetical protein